VLIPVLVPLWGELGRTVSKDRFAPNGRNHTLPYCLGADSGPVLVPGTRRYLHILAHMGCVPTVLHAQARCFYLEFVDRYPGFRKKRTGG